MLITSQPLHGQWLSTTADARYRIERSASSASSADTGTFLIWPGDGWGSNTAVQVFTTNGIPVGHSILWAAEGEPATVLFDCSSHAFAYDVYTGPESGVRPEWTMTQGLILETRKRAGGDPVNAKAIRKICADSTPVLGRSLIPGIFLGVHPHGPTADFVSLIEGAFSVEKAGTYEFATISEDASCLSVDGKLIAQWPGWHECHGGRKGQHQGSVKLAAGTHRLEYLNVKQGPGYTVEAAWRPPGRQNFEIMPASAFGSVATYTVTTCETAPSRPPEARFSWHITSHFSSAGASLVAVSFTALTAGERYAWMFDDGARYNTRTVEHVFLSAGLRTVKLDVQTPAGTASLSRKVSVHPLWIQGKDEVRPVLEAVRRRLIRDDFDAAPVADITSVYRIATDEKLYRIAAKFAVLCLNRNAEFDADHARVFGEIALFLQHPEIQDYAHAEKAFTVMLESPVIPADQKAWAAIHLAGLLINSLGRIEDAQVLLRRVDVTRLSDSDKRLRLLYEGDAFLATGQLDRAREAYVSSGTTAARGDTRQALRQQARLETARDYLRRGEVEPAETMVRQIEWDAPEQRMATEPGFIRVRICMAQKEYLRALLLARRLLPAVTPESRKADMLSNIVESCLALGRDAEAVEAYRQLREGYPYSEASARTKDVWDQKHVNRPSE